MRWDNVAVGVMMLVSALLLILVVASAIGGLWFSAT